MLGGRRIASGSTALGILILLLLAVLIATSGCAGSAEGTQGEADASTTSSTEVILPAGGATSSTSADSSTTSTSEATGGGPWTIYVDQTIPKSVQGMEVDYTLTLIAQKAEGDGPLGTYKGQARITVAMDASALGGGVLNVSGGFNEDLSTQDLTFEVTGYDEEKYSSFESDVPLAPLVTYDAMALITSEMSGSGSFDVSVSGPQGEHGGTDFGAAASTAVPMRLTVLDGKVEVYVPVLKLDTSFQGIITSDAAQGEEKKQAAEDKLTSTTTTAPGTTPSATTPGGGSSAGNTGGLGDVLGTVGSDLPLPKNWPSWMPVADDANIVSVRDSNPNALGITYTTKKTLDQIKALYAGIVSQMGATPTPLDNEGVMYMDSYNGKPVTMVIMDQPSVGVIVMIDVGI